MEYCEMQFSGEDLHILCGAAGNTGVVRDGISWSSHDSTGTSDSGQQPKI